MNRWVEAARVRTLPLALSVCFAAGTSALYVSTFNKVQFAFLLLTIMTLQVLSNYANDMGDFMNGADNSHRVGPKRQVQAGLISLGEMKWAVIFLSFVALISGLLFLYFSTINLLSLVIFISLGLISIWAAIRYTAGKNPYGYNALGDVSVFLFFGPVGVIGSAFVLTGSMVPSSILLSIAMGSFATMVLNLNNMRDVESDRMCKKITIVVKYGRAKAEVYHLVLFVLGSIPVLIFGWLVGWVSFSLSLIFVFALFISQNTVWSGSNNVNYDMKMKPLALIIFAHNSLQILVANFTG